MATRPDNEIIQISGPISLNQSDCCVIQTKQSIMTMWWCTGTKVMLTSSNGNIFRVTGHLCGEFPTQRPVMWNFDVCFDMRLNKRSSKQSWGWWFETPWCPIWCHCNGDQHFEEQSRGQTDEWKLVLWKDHVHYVPSKCMNTWRNTMDIKNNAWVTVITIFGSQLRRFANDFHEWRSHEWKLLVNRVTSDPKIVIHGNECVILFLTCYFMSWTHNSTKNNHWSLISQLSPRTVVSDLALWRHHSGSVKSREREILALWRHICWLFLHAQIGAKAIFTSE